MGLLGICLWRAGFEAAFEPDRMGEKGGGVAYYVFTEDVTVCKTCIRGFDSLLRLQLFMRNRVERDPARFLMAGDLTLGYPRRELDKFAGCKFQPGLWACPEDAKFASGG